MQLRMIKSREEIEIIKSGARIADLGGEELGFEEPGEDPGA